MRNFVKSGIALAAFAACSVSYAATPLVDVNWLKDHSCGWPT